MIHLTIKNFNNIFLLELKFKYEQDDECQHIPLMFLTLIVGVKFNPFEIEFPFPEKYNST